MLIDISDILYEVGDSKELKGELHLEQIFYQGETLRFDRPLAITGTISNMKDFLLLKAQVSGEVLLVCGKCLDPYEFPLNFPIEAKLKKGSSDEDPDVFIYEGEQIELKDIVVEYLLLELPIERRCKQDCKGLCPYCGTNLNRDQCRCQRKEEKDQEEEFDERLSVLKDFFSPHDKEV